MKNQNPKAYDLAALLIILSTWVDLFLCDIFTWSLSRRCPTGISFSVKECSPLDSADSCRSRRQPRTHAVRTFRTLSGVAEVAAIDVMLSNGYSKDLRWRVRKAVVPAPNGQMIPKDLSVRGSQLFWRRHLARLFRPLRLLQNPRQGARRVGMTRLHGQDWCVGRTN